MSPRFLRICAIVGSMILSGECAAAEPASEPAPSETHSHLSREEFNALIDSLANKNEAPTKGGWERPVYSDDYDHKEDVRVRRVASVISKFPGEDRWWCLTEHLDDQRYAITFSFNDYEHIATIGVLCWQMAANDLDAPFGDLISNNFGIEFSRTSKPEFQDWYRAHKDVPLYKQQIEHGEAILKKLDELNRTGGELWIPAKEDKPKFKRDIGRQIELLKRTKKPIISRSDLIPTEK